MKTNQNPTPNPSTEGNQLDVSQPGNSRFSNVSCENTLYKQCNRELRAPPYSRCIGIGGSPSSSLVIKTVLLLHWISAPWWSLGDFATWAQKLSHVQLFVTPWTVAYQALLSMGFSTQEYWNGYKASVKPCPVSHTFYHIILHIYFFGY